VGEVIWSGGEIHPGEYVDFPLSVAIPNTPGATLTFKALQTYSNGDVERWIGAPDADRPAPQVLVLDANAAVADVPSGATTSADSGRDGLTLGLAIAGLAVAVVALVLVLVRRRA